MSDETTTKPEKEVSMKFTGRTALISIIVRSSATPALIVRGESAEVNCQQDWRGKGWLLLQLLHSVIVIRRAKC